MHIFDSVASQLVLSHHVYLSVGEHPFKTHFMPHLRSFLSHCVLFAPPILFVFGPIEQMLLCTESAHFNLDPVFCCLLSVETQLLNKHTDPVLPAEPS